MPRSPGPSGFGFESTAEQVTDGIDLSGTTWLITGCNSGLGLETSRVLALRGAHVIGAARTHDKAANAFAEHGIEGSAVACELSDVASVRACVASLMGRTLDGIIANAGIMALPELRQQQGVELQFLTNHVGHFVLVNGLVNQLTPQGRVVILSSGAHFLAKERGLELENLSGETEYHPWRMYGRSKLANVLFARGLASRFSAAGSGRTANAVHPGVIATNLARHVPDPEALFGRMRDRMKTVPQGAATQCYVAVHPAVQGVTAQYFADCNVADMLPQARSDEAAEALWTATEALLDRLEN